MIFRVLTLLSALVVSGDARATLTARWLGVAGLTVSDGDTTLLFDPVFTKPGIHHWLFNSEFKSDPIRVENGLKNAGIQQADALFASHCHFDHASDVGLISQKTGAVVHGGPSLRKIALGDPVVRAKFEEMTDGSAFTIGRFKIIPYRREHSPILRTIHWKFLPGPIRDDFHFEFYGYREGETWGFRIEHPEGNLLIDQTSQWRPKNAAYAGATDTYFVGVANTPSLAHLIDENIRQLNARRIIPLHFDWFFLQSNWLEALILPGTRLEEISAQLNTPADQKFIIPSKYQPIPIGRTAH